MKRKTLISVAFLLVLFIVPTILSTSYGIAGIAAGPNIDKDFSLSDAWNQAGGNATFDVDMPSWNQAGGNASFGVSMAYPYGGPPSPQSIAGFEETISDDVLYYPDMYVQEATYGNASGGAITNDYTYTILDDGNEWDVYDNTASNPLYMYLDVEGPILAGTVYVYFEYSCMSAVESGDLYLYLYNPYGADLLIHSQSGITFGNDTSVEISDWLSYEINGNHTFYYYVADNSDDSQLALDHFYISDTQGYAESFSDVSEWQLEFESTGLPSKSFISDGDVTTLEIGFDDAGNEYARYNVSLTGLAVTDYIEFSFISSVTAGSYRSAALTVLLNDVQICREYSSTWKTMKFYIEDYIDVAPTTLAIQVDDYANPHASDTGYIKFDYVRISPANETGWQHDASTTEGYNDAGGGSSTTDGDKVNLIADADGSSWYFFVDTTSTGAYLDLDDYPFFKISITGGSGSWTLKQYDGAYDVIQSSTAINTGIHRFYAKTISDTSKEIRIDMIANSVMEIDFLGYYSIANYSVTSSGCDTDDYLYTENGVLHSVVDSGDITLNYDIPIYITYPYYGWALNTSLGIPEVDFYDSAWSWLGYSSETEGQLPYARNITDVRFKFTDSANIISLTFVDLINWRSLTSALFWFDTPDWISISIAIIRFAVELNTIMLNSSLTLAGLVLIPGSTLYLAYNIKHRDEMSVEKFLAFLLAFFCGWALFLGGIL